MAAANGNGGTRAQGPRCIALVGPFQTGKTTLLEAILARTGAIQRQGTVEAGTTRRRRLQGGAPSQDERRAHRRHHHFHGRQLHLHRLPRLRRIHPRHARGAARGRCRGRGLRGRREEDAAASVDPARARRPQHSALSVPQQDRQGRDQGDGGAADPAAGLAQAAGDAPASDPAERHRHRLRRSRARARPCLQGARRHPRWCRSTARISTAARMRASPCWRSSPTTTTN